MTLRRQLLYTFVLFVAVVLGGVLGAFGYRSIRSHEDVYRQQRLRDARVVARALAGRSESDQRDILRSRFPDGSLTDGWLVRLGADPGTLYSNRQSFPNPAAAEELREARQGPDAAVIGISPRGERLLVAVPVLSGGRLEGILWFSASLDPVAELDQDTRFAVFTAWSLGVLVAAGLASVISRRMARRIEVLEAASAGFAQGRFDTRVQLEGSDEFALLAQRLNVMADRLDVQMGQQREFVAAASHQIRTPLTAIRLRVEELQTLVGAGPGDAAQLLREIVAQVDRLAEMAARLLDLSSLDHRQGVEELDVIASVQEVLAELEPVAAGRVRLRVMSGPAVRVATTSGGFPEVVMNLVDNALKYSPAASEVIVETEDARGSLVLRVIDGGPGIREHDRERVLRPFVRGSERDAPGHGLGLAICARICAREGATLEIADRPGRGTIVTVRWPLASRTRTKEPAVSE